jgi:hypothetical protein
MQENFGPAMKNGDLIGRMIRNARSCLKVGQGLVKDPKWTFIAQFG